MLESDPLEYYRTHGVLTDPGPWACLFDDLPRDIAALCRVLQGVMMHYDTAALRGVILGEDRIDDANLRHVSRLLGRITELDPRPLIKRRPPHRRLAVNCRDFAVMLCAVLRHQGVAARARCGFARYFHCSDLQPDVAYDHWLCEFWAEDEERWVLVDAEVDQVERRYCAIRLNTLDVPRDQFLVAGKAWQMCRRGEAEPNKFGLGLRSLHGLWFVASQVVRDLAAMNKRELLCWDTWGLGDKGEDDEFTASELELLDYIAMLSQQGNDSLPELWSLYDAEPAVRVPSIVNSYTARGMVTADVSI